MSPTRPTRRPAFPGPWPLTLGLLLPAALVAALVEGRGADAPAARSAPGEVRRVGTSGCVAAGCHGGTSGPAGRETAYTTWVRSDPHARAFEALFNDRSTRMAERLARGSGRNAEVIPPERDARCLACHAHPGAKVPTDDGLLAALRDGVDCESCHGAASEWLEPHKVPGWSNRPSAELRAKGMQPTRDLQARAALCAGCHVGEAGRDVDHDLIAAGHPRLQFELATYLANLPKHWDASAEKRRQPDLEVRAWVAGQLANSRASLALLETRATRALNDPSRWPEFSEMDCFGCHHELVEPSWRRARGERNLPGTPRWNSWSQSQTIALGEALGLPDVSGVRANLDEIGRLMRRQSLGPEAVQRAAGRAGETVDGWLRGLNSVRFGPQFLASQTERLVREGQNGRIDWDTAVQVSVGLQALVQAGDEQGHPAAPGTRAILETLSGSLAFPPGWDSPGRLGPLGAGPFGEALRLLPRPTNAP